MARIDPTERHSGYVLVVDDAQPIRVCMQRLLEAGGFDVRTAENGAEALALMHGAARPPALIFTDYSMPVMNGGLLLRTMRLDPLLRDVPAVMISATQDAEPAAASAAAGFLLKPADPEEVLRLARQWITRA